MSILGGFAYIEVAAVFVEILLTCEVRVLRAWGVYFYSSEFLFTIDGMFSSSSEFLYIFTAASETFFFMTGCVFILVMFFSGVCWV